MVVTNKITHIINCAALTIPNHLEPIGVIYLSYTWKDEEHQTILNLHVATEIYQFIEDAASKFESCLVYSTKGQSRSSTVIAAYLIQKYKWSLLKSLEFLNSRRPDLEIRTCFLQQLSSLESILIESGNGPKTADWNHVHDKCISYENEEPLLTNTFKNSKLGDLEDYETRISTNKKEFTIKFSQNLSKAIVENERVSVIDNHKKASNIKPILRKKIGGKHKENKSCTPMKFVIKGSYKAPLCTINLSDTKDKALTNAILSEIKNVSTNRNRNQPMQKNASTMINPMCTYRNRPIKSTASTYIRPESASKKTPTKAKMVKPKAKPHSRPSSPGLYGKIIRPSYCLGSAMSINKKLDEQGKKSIVSKIRSSSTKDTRYSSTCKLRDAQNLA